MRTVMVSCVVAGRNDLGGRNRAEYRVIHREAGPDAGHGVRAGRIAPDGAARRVGIELVVEGVRSRHHFPRD